MSIEGILVRKGTHVETIDPHATVKLAADSLRNKRIAALVVLRDGTISGILSERDIVDAISLYGERALTKSVEDILSPKLVTVSPKDSVKHAMSLMTDHRVRHLPVLDEGKLVGIVSIGDVVKHRLEELELETNVLRDVYIAAAR